MGPPSWVGLVPLEALCVEESSSNFSETPLVSWDRLGCAVPLQHSATGAPQSLATAPLRGNHGAPGLTYMHPPCLVPWLGPGSRRSESLHWLGWYFFCGIVWNGPPAGADTLISCDRHSRQTKVVGKFRA